MIHYPASHPLDPIHRETDDADRQVIQILTRSFDAVKQAGAVQREEAPLRDTERQHGARAFWVQDDEALHQSVPFDRRVLKEILNQSRRLQEGPRHLGDADSQVDRPSVTEVLTIEQYGYPRTYNLNDGMGPDSDCPCQVSKLPVAHLPPALRRIGA